MHCMWTAFTTVQGEKWTDGWTDSQIEWQLVIHKIPALLHLLVKGVSQFSHFIFLQPQLIFLLPQKTASKDRIAYS